MHYLYFLYSESLSQSYCGETQDLTDRILRHNAGRSKSTKRGIPWELKGFVQLENRALARTLEQQIKNRGICRWIADNGHRVTPVA